MNVIPFRHHDRSKAVPPIVFVEMFEDIPEAPCRLRPEPIMSTLANCRILLDHARSAGWPLGFVVAAERARRNVHGGLPWIDGFRPQRTDMVFETTENSCYSSEAFADAMTDAGNCYLIAGFSGECIGLATLVEASRHGHDVGLIEDAVHSEPLSGCDAFESHRALVAVASSHAKILSAKGWLEIAGTPHSELEVFDDDQ